MDIVILLEFFNRLNEDRSHKFIAQKYMIEKSSCL